MAVEIVDLQRRVEVLEQEMRRLANVVEDAERGTMPTLLEFRRMMGIPEDLEPMDPREVRELMLSQGVRPEDRLGSSEILRMREE